MESLKPDFFLSFFLFPFCRFLLLYPVDSWKLGLFVGGLLSASLPIGAWMVARSFVTISPERVFHQSMRYLAASKAVSVYL